MIKRKIPIQILTPKIQFDFSHKIKRKTQHQANWRYESANDILLSSFA